MHIKRIELFGFRSYQDQTVIGCSPGLKVIYDNASADLFTSIRWAFMEKRLQALSCRRLDELIFPGDSQRRALNFTEVNVVLDNTDKTLPLDWDVIEIRRRYHRQGESEFFLNRISCRLKDISELLQNMLNTESIALWGASDRIEFVDLLPESRRRLWDITAGYLVHRNRMKDLISKHRETQQNMEQVSILASELSLRLEQVNVREDPVYKDQLNLEERLNFLNEQQSYLDAAIEKENRTLQDLKGKVIEGFVVDFPRLCRAFAFETKRWIGMEASLMMTRRDDPAVSGIDIEGLPKQLSATDRSAVGWAFWVACIKVLKLPISVLQLSPGMDGAHLELLTTVLKELAPSMQLVVCTQKNFELYEKPL